MKTWKTKYCEMFSEIYALISGARVQIEHANFWMGMKDISEEKYNYWRVIRQQAIFYAEELSKRLGIEWKKEYEDE